MDDQISIDAQALISEVVRYLETVELFRAQQCEPAWLPEIADRVAHTWVREKAEVSVATK